MKTIVNTLIAAGVLVLATACALLAPLKLDDEARNAAAITLKAYSVMQQAILIYGRLPDCAAPPVTHICKRRDDWQRLQSAEKAATEAIAAAAPVLNANQLDTGELARALLAIDQVRTALARAQALWKGKNS